MLLIAVDNDVKTVLQQLSSVLLVYYYR